MMINLDTDGHDRLGCNKYRSMKESTPLEADYYTDEQIRMQGEEQFCRLVRAFGSERVLFGTDSPWADQAAYLQAMRALPLTDREKQDILGGYACRLLGL